MIVMVGLFNEPEEGGRGQENDREWTVLKYIISVYKDARMKCTKSSWLIGEQRT
jgi:hypothetical protein